MNTDDTVTKVIERQDGWPRTMFPSISNPKDITGAVFKYYDDIIKDRRKVDTSHLVEFNPFYSIVRIYRDVFLAHDGNTKSWVLFRFITS